MVTIIDIGLGNVNSVSRALDFLRVPNRVSGDLDAIDEANQLIFPGVGNFSEATKRIFSSGVAKKIREQVFSKKKPLLGICLGMQLLAKTGEEGGLSEGLGIIDAKVSRLPSESYSLRLPHIGWNEVTNNRVPLFQGIVDQSCFYFVHSYEMVLNENSVEYATCNYGIDFVAAVKKGNVVGVQFHPEKSQKPGLQILKNFIEGNY